MRDQGATLRNRVREKASLSESAPANTDTEVLVVGSGKGGVGKSVISVGIATTVAAAGYRVLLVDGDQNLGNLHVLLGLRPALTPEAFLEDEVTAEDLLVEVAPGLWLVPADSGAAALQRLGTTDRARLQARISALYPGYDLVVVDAGAGLESAVRCAALRATRLLVTTLPEPAALTDAYALIKIVNHELPGLPIQVVVNRVSDQAEAQAAWIRLSEAADRFLSRSLGYFGWIPEDHDFRDRFRRGATLLEPQLAGPAMAAVQVLAQDQILAEFIPRHAPSG